MVSSRICARFAYRHCLARHRGPDVATEPNEYADLVAYDRANCNGDLHSEPNTHGHDCADGHRIGYGHRHVDAEPFANVYPDQHAGAKPNTSSEQHSGTDRNPRPERYPNTDN